MKNLALIALIALKEHEAQFDRIIACCHSQEDLEIYQAALKQLS